VDGEREREREMQGIRERLHLLPLWALRVLLFVTETVRIVADKREQERKTPGR
jgi:hypothetical protein